MTRSKHERLAREVLEAKPTRLMERWEMRAETEETFPELATRSDREDVTACDKGHREFLLETIVGAAAGGAALLSARTRSV